MGVSMSDSHDKGVLSDLLDVFGKVDRIVAIIALALTYISNSANQPLLAVVFVIVACFALDTWLWRLANSKVATNLLSNHGRTVMRPRLATWQSISLKSLSTVMTLAALIWIIIVVVNIVHPSSTPITLSPQCNTDDHLPLEWNNMVCVPEGNFWMGSDDGPQDSRPMHQVFVSAFWIEKYEVSVGQYAKFLQTHPELSRPEDWHNGLKPNYPVDEVSWADAQLFCNATGKRLPTEAEWEKAARGENKLIYPYENQFDAKKSNSALTGLGTAWPIGFAPDGASPYGALDMAGNVAEWVNDLYDPQYYSSSEKFDPRGPGPLNPTHVVRGGSYADAPEVLRTFARNGIYEASDSFPGIGFRCVLSKTQ